MHYSLFHSSTSPLLLSFSLFSLSCPLINLFKDSLLHCGRQWAPRTRSHEHSSASFRKELRFEMIESNGPQRFEALESNVPKKQGQIERADEHDASAYSDQDSKVWSTRREVRRHRKGSRSQPQRRRRCRPLLIEVMVLQHSELQQSRRSPPTAGRD